MPHYAFTISRNGQLQPSASSECPNDDAAKREAAGMFADMARDIANRMPSIHDWQMDVTDASGKVIFKIRITAE
jgi:hypothetical protein